MVGWIGGGSRSKWTNEGGSLARWIACVDALPWAGRVKSADLQPAAMRVRVRDAGCEGLRGLVGGRTFSFSSAPIEALLSCLSLQSR